ncbi:hypothetical protein P2318_26965 [Myxococcaceae bacterium GXIMD 01537]
MLGFIKDAVSAVTSPLTGAIDLVGDSLGLPKLLTQSIKAGIGIATGNVMLVADGALGVMSELVKNPPAKTEFVPPRDTCRASEGYAPKPAAPPGASAPSQGGILDPSVLQYRDSLRQLSANFDLLDTLEGGTFTSKNGKISQETLRKAEGNPRLSQGLRDACRFLLSHPEYRNQLDTAGKGGRVDGTISMKDVQAALAKVNADIARYGVSSPPTAKPQAPAAPAHPASPATSTPAAPAPSAPASSKGGASHASGGGASATVRDILNNPNLSIEEKIQAILMALEQNIDDEILKTMDDLAAAQDKRAGIENNEGNKKALQDADRNAEFIQMRLQQLMEKRKAMFDLMSNMSSKFNEMAKTAISNLRSA